eukprot:1056133-Alexandrium_andersonii.AAC.1
MSASLVGSEMCIRDSFLRSQGFRLQVAAPHASGRKRSDQIWSSPALSSCLLYTSDAADDM